MVHSVRILPTFVLLSAVGGYLDEIPALHSSVGIPRDYGLEKCPKLDSASR